MFTNRSNVIEGFPMNTYLGILCNSDAKYVDQTITPWLQSVVRSLQDKGYFSDSAQAQELNSDYILELYNRTIGSFYLLHQSSDIFNEEENSNATSHLIESSIGIYLNEEVREYLDSYGVVGDDQFLWFYNDLIYEGVNASIEIHSL